MPDLQTTTVVDMRLPEDTRVIDTHGEAMPVAVALRLPGRLSQDASEHLRKSLREVFEDTRYRDVREIVLEDNLTLELIR